MREGHLSKDGNQKKDNVSDASRTAPKPFVSGQEGGAAQPNARESVTVWRRHSCPDANRIMTIS
jgi:hypothetical protein